VVKEATGFGPSVFVIPGWSEGPGTLESRDLTGFHSSRARKMTDIQLLVFATRAGGGRAVVGDNEGRLQPSRAEGVGIVPPERNRMRGAGDGNEGRSRYCDGGEVLMDRASSGI